MYLCYVDEAGCPGALPSATSDIQPVLLLCGLFVTHARLAAITTAYLSLKVRFHPKLRGPRWLDSVKAEIKGSDLKRDVRRAGRNRQRAVFGFLDSVFDLLAANDCRIVARIYVKCAGGRFPGAAVYAASVQSLCTSFQRYLEERDALGLMIADSRNAALNSVVSHSIFTQKFRVGGDPFDRLVELPTFGHSENHVLLQISDLVCSAVLMPMATDTYCAGHIESVHVNATDFRIRSRYAQRVKEIRYRFIDAGKVRGGITVNDAIGQRASNLIFAL